MKRYFVCIIAILFIITSITVPSVLAQQTGLLFALTPYQTREDLDFLFSNSQTSLDYLEGDEVPEPVFLSLVTDQQKTTIKTAGYRIKIVDTNADLSEYKLLWHPKVNQASLLQGMGIAIQISDHYTLFRAPANRTFDHPEIIGQFWPKTFTGPIATPRLRTKTTETVPKSISPSVKPKLPKASAHAIPQAKSNLQLWLSILLIAGGLVLGIASTLYWYKRNHQPTEPTPVPEDPLPPEQPDAL